jgi:hypothetical protein
MAATKSYEVYKRTYFPERRIAMVSITLENIPEYYLEPVKLLAESKVSMLSCVLQSHPDKPLV